MNIELARKTIEHIDAHPDEHLQLLWHATGVRLRDAIWLCARNEFYAEHGRSPFPVEDAELKVHTLAALPACGTAACFAGHAVLIAGFQVESSDEAVLTEVEGEFVYRPIRDVAIELLGLDEAQASILFAGGNTVDQLWEILGEYSGGEIARP